MRLLSAPIVLVAACLVSCDETKHARYATAADAVADGAIARGWLPQVFDANVLDIHESHDIDSNRGSADFRYEPRLIPRLEQQCASKPATDGHLRFQCGHFNISLDPARHAGKLSY